MTNEESLPRHYSKREIANLLGVGESTVEKRVARGLIRKVKVEGGHPRYVIVKGTVEAQ